MKVIIFDFDGTLADSLTLMISVFNSQAERFNYRPVGVSEVDLLRGKSARDLIRGLGIAKLKLPLVYSEGKKEFMRQMGTLQPFPGIKEMLQSLHESYTLGIVTSNNTESVSAFLKTHDVELFQFIYSDKSLFGKGKILKKVLKKYEYTAADVLYVGDEVRDIDAARESGIKIVSVSWGFNTKEILLKNNPDALIESPSSLPLFMASLDSAE